MEPSSLCIKAGRRGATPPSSSVRVSWARHPSAQQHRPSAALAALQSEGPRPRPRDGADGAFLRWAGLGLPPWSVALAVPWGCAPCSVRLSLSRKLLGLCGRDAAGPAGLAHTVSDPAAHRAHVAATAQDMAVCMASFSFSSMFPIAYGERCWIHAL